MRGSGSRRMGRGIPAVVGWRDAGVCACADGVVIAGRNGARLTDVRFLALACVLDVVLRLPLLMLEVVPTSDFEWYFDAARSIAAGDGFTDKGVLTAFWPVGWPGFLGGLLWMFGAHVWVGQFANLLLSAGVICLMMVVGKRLFPSSAAWRVAVLLIVVFPNQIAYVPLMSVEIFFEFLLLLGFVLMMSQSVRTLAASGLVFGVAALTKTQAVFVPAMLGLPLLVAGAGRWVRMVVLTGVVMLAVILPWTARNYSVFHAFIPVSTNGGYTLLTGNNPSARGRYTWDDPLVADLSKAPEDQVEMDRVARDRAMAWIEANPGTFVKLIPLKVLRLWSGDGEAEWLYESGYAGYEAHAWMFRAVRIVNQGFYLMVLGLAAASVPWMWRQRESLPVWCWSGWAVMGYFTVISAVFSGQSRFHFALMPFVGLYAAWVLTEWRSGSGAAGSG
jgi:4-amino-4-deoxy-L-arabinose transferase-like glycosyltransferase